MGGQPRVEVRKSRIDGKGLFAVTRIKARSKIGEMAGEAITQAEARRRAQGKRRIALVELGDGKAVDGRRKGNAFRYVNHSCSPNAYMRVCYGRVEIYSLRAIRPGEEITCNYGPTHHDGNLRCRCGSDNCRGTL
jgi:SET domain-containing protein